MFRWKQISTLCLALLICCLFLTSSASACPTCRDGVANDPAAASLIQGYFWSICFMMSMPFLILGGITAYFYYEIRRARAKQLTSAGRHAVAPAADAATPCEEPALVP